MDLTVKFRFFGELNDFLSSQKEENSFSVVFKGNPSVKDLIEATGVPHTEIDIILINGKSVSFSYKLSGGEQIDVYPVFERSVREPVIHLAPLPESKSFILDVHLGKLTRVLRLLGFDASYRNDYSDPQIVNTGVKENRIILTRDKGILKYKNVKAGYWIRSTNYLEQAREVVRRFDLCGMINPFSRCMLCNGRLVKVEKTDILLNLEEKTRLFYNKFSKCDVCGKVFWEGSHFERLQDLIKKICPNQQKYGEKCGFN